LLAVSVDLVKNVHRVCHRSGTLLNRVAFHWKSDVMKWNPTVVGFGTLGLREPEDLRVAGIG
jgi:hypothetical protein